MKVLVGEYHLCTYETFCDLLDYEVFLLLDLVPYSYKQEWEMFRYLTYLNLLPYIEAKNKKPMEQMLPLYTDKLDKDNTPKEEDKNKVDEMQSMADNILQALKTL